MEGYWERFEIDRTNEHYESAVHNFYKALKMGFLKRIIYITKRISPAHNLKKIGALH